MTIIPTLISSEAQKAIVDETFGLIKMFLAPLLIEGGELCHDFVRTFRFGRQLKLLRKAQNNVKEAGFSPKAVNMRVLFPLLEAAVLEEDEDMFERWASLLASAANPNCQSALEASFIEILKQLAPPHAYLFEVFYEQIERNKLPPENWAEYGYDLSTLRDFLKKEVPDFAVAVENLLRLNLVAYPTAKLGIANGQEVRVKVTSGNILCATSLGYAFASACGHGRTHRNLYYSISGNSISNIFGTQGGSLNILPELPAKAIPPLANKALWDIRNLNKSDTL
jgi:hypothetical protein